jgi:hypothetical protein
MNTTTATEPMRYMLEILTLPTWERNYENLRWRGVALCDDPAPLGERARSLAYLQGIEARVYDRERDCPIALYVTGRAPTAETRLYLSDYPRE